ncbi:hypothetical protein [Streptosporangium lutulentum]|uniref:Uncharacterized protein n=1 Tax=Streptosporangium lutulentum TaxID=1461250 RepID=A0ABT9QU04_9ACTN|nr:hypothetical protein [Streptosporangium lutulentum]MDP9850253.1 hypothetical protein [Streptosporangium lutulentum]
MAPAQAPRVPAESLDVASGLALDAAKKAARIARKRAQIRLGFISRPTFDPQAPLPPLARCLRGGRGGQVRLKLLLTYLWMQTKDHGVALAYPAQVWARLLDLDQPETAGARRINEAQAWLEGHMFIATQAQPGHANKVTVLNETGNDEPYIAPGAAAKALSNDPEKARPHYYAQIPATLWTNGYIQLMTGAGLAMYLILLDQYALTGAAPQPVWISPSAFKAYYGLSQDTRAAGIKDLTELGLVTTGRQSINPNDFDLERIRNVYTLKPDQLDVPARRLQQPVRGSRDEFVDPHRRLARPKM